MKIFGSLATIALVLVGAHPCYASREGNEDEKVSLSLVARDENKKSWNLRRGSVRDDKPLNRQLTDEADPVHIELVRAVGLDKCPEGTGVASPDQCLVAVMWLELPNVNRDVPVVKDAPNLKTKSPCGCFVDSTDGVIHWNSGEFCTAGDDETTYSLVCHVDLAKRSSGLDETMLLDNEDAAKPHDSTASTMEVQTGRGNPKGSLVGVDKAASPDVDGSCPKSNNPVCVGGDTYQNACLAIAQGETDYENGPCRGDKPQHFRGSDSKISRDKMDKYAQEGFKLIGQIEMSEGIQHDLQFDRNSGQNPTQPDARAYKMLHRITPEGYKYVAKDHQAVPVVPGGDGNNGHPDFGDNPPPMTPGFHEIQTKDETEEEGGRRKLNVNHISNTGTWPHWRLGEVDWSGGEGGCSGTIIAPNKVLTAAHCVYDSYSNQWQVPHKFAPGRKRVCEQTCFIWCWTTCSTLEPWSTWEVDSVTIFAAYADWVPPGANLINAEGTSWDVAIMHMRTNHLGSIGSYMGTLSLTTPPCTVDTGSEAAGYPASRDDGEMWSTGTCSWWSSGCQYTRYIDSSCESAGGMSGSGLRDSSERVFGILSSGATAYDTQFFAFEQWVIDSVLSW